MSDIHPHSREDLNELADFAGRVIVPTVATNHTGHICIPRYRNGTQCWCLRPIAGAALALLLAVEPAQACTPTRDPPKFESPDPKPDRDTGGDHNWWEEPRRSQQIRGGSEGC